ncbi:MAG: aryl-sulfate sulfotransferase [Myxococcota bacterium]|nr:aryl-sulfate sulfotransferase [Myxococcota bacterium]
MKCFTAALVVFPLFGCSPKDEALLDTGGFSFGEVKIEKVEANAHAVWVSVGVSEPARIRVEFSQLGESPLVTAWSDEAVRHRVPLVGLLGGADSVVVVHAETPQGEFISEPLDFSTSEAAEFRRPTVSGDSLDRRPNGVMYLMDQTDRRTSAGADGPTRFVGVDQLGRLIWDHNSGDNTLGHAPFVEVLETGNFFYRTATGGVELTPMGEIVASFDAGEDLHHDAERLPNGNWVLMTQTYDTVESEELGPFTVVGDGLVEVDPEGKEVWRWEIRDHLDWEETQTEFNDPSEGLKRSDWTHANSVQYVEEDDGFLMSIRHLSQVIFIDRSSGEILWTLGEGGDFELTKGVWFSGQHDAQLLGNGEMLLYDNSLNGSLPESRGLRLGLDFDEMSVEILQEFNAGVAAYSMGSIRLLESGGVLLSSGGHRTDGVPSRVMEFGPAGEEVLRMEQALMKQLNYRTGAYYYAEPL